MNDHETETVNNGRETNGQFAKGNQFARGHQNPMASVAQKLKKALQDAVTTDDIRQIVKKQVELAKQGNTRAAELVLERSIGKVAQPLKGDFELYRGDIVFKENQPPPKC